MHLINYQSSVGTPKYFISIWEELRLYSMLLSNGYRLTEWKERDNARLSHLVPHWQQNSENQSGHELVESCCSPIPFVFHPKTPTFFLSWQLIKKKSSHFLSKALLFRSATGSALLCHTSQLVRRFTLFVDVSYPIPISWEYLSLLHKRLEMRRDALYISTQPTLPCTPAPSQRHLKVW